MTSIKRSKQTRGCPALKDISPTSTPENEPSLRKPPTPRQPMQPKSCRKIASITPRRSPACGLGSRYRRGKQKRRTKFSPLVIDDRPATSTSAQSPPVQAPSNAASETPSPMPQSPRLGPQTPFASKHGYYSKSPLTPPQQQRQSPQEPRLPPFVYHYTDLKGCDSILKQKRIRSQEAKYGKGVYMTELPPNRKTVELLCNNYGNPTYCESVKMVAKSEYAFQLRSGDLRGLRRVKDVSERKVYLYPWDIDLDPRPVEVHVRKFKDSESDEWKVDKVLGKTFLGFNDVVEGSMC